MGLSGLLEKKTNKQRGRGHKFERHLGSSSEWGVEEKSLG